MITDIETKVCNILKQYPIKRAALFGSAARGDMSEKSDIDLLVDYTPGGGGLFWFFGLHADLEETFGCHVDLITYDGLYEKAKPEFREAVLKDERVIYEC